MTEAELREKIFSDEVNYNHSLINAAELISKTDTKLLLLSGPSCAGKTTTSKRLQANLVKRGKGISVISLDDFYLGPEKSPKTPDGKPDFESIYALDLPYIQECFSDLVKGKTVKTPTFDFNLHCRTDEYNEIKLEDGDICIVEGLHALNPLITADLIEPKYIFKIFLESYKNSDSPEKTRILRRLVRDYHYRSSDANRTFEMWDNVVSSELINIRPFSRYANATINTYFEYEAGVLKKPALEVLSTLDDGSEYEGLAREIKDSLEYVHSVPLDMVPKDSLLQEFIPPVSVWNRYK
ncbi:MAG: nucleoside kinase [Eubacteriales bacterium]|nr:nucleoside kinase [Eubacteriales bacterium]